MAILHFPATAKSAYDLRILSFAGRGSKSIVYRAEDINTRKKFMVKELFPHILEASNVLSRSSNGDVIWSIDSYDYRDMIQFHFQHGFSIIERCIHSNPEFNGVVKPVGCFQHHNTLYIISEDDGSVEWNPYKESSIRTIISDFIDVCNLIGNLHKTENCVLVLDVAASNFVKSDHVRLCDFDSLLYRHECINGVKMLFSDENASPELLAQKREEITSLSDVYSIGSLLHRVLIAFQQNNETPQLPPFVLDALFECCCSSMRCNPSNRLSSAFLFASKLKMIYDML